MDKTRNKIFVGCLALLLVMVAGYALFSQNLTINGIAKAQGDFSVTMTCTPGLTNKGFLNADYIDYAPTKDNNYTNILIKFYHIRYTTERIPRYINFVLIICKINTKYEQYVH